MLKALSIKNIAVIENVNIDFDKGFNILTGETGAGKSIIIDSLNLLKGERAQKNIIRNGETKARVDGVFELGKNEAEYVEKDALKPAKCVQEISIREAVFSKHEEIAVEDAKDRICASPAVSCPPAIPIAISGEKIDENAIALFEYYGISNVDVMKEL